MTAARIGIVVLAVAVTACSFGPRATLQPRRTPTRPPVPVTPVPVTPVPATPAPTDESPTGLSTVIAGSGQKGNSGDGGPATQAEMFKPIGLGLAPDGTLYVTECDPNLIDASANRVRRISPDGVIETIVGGVKPEPGFSGDGGPATDAQLKCPFAVAADGDGNVYIADIHNHRIRKVDATGTITTIAGTGESKDTGDGGEATAASLNSPAEVLVAADGDLLIASGPYIRRIADDGTISMFAGGGTPSNARFGVPRWTDDQDGTLAVDATFSDSGGMAWGPDGALYFADYWDDRVLMIDEEGLVHVVAGDGSKPTAADDDGDGGPAVEAKLRNPSDVAVGPDGSVYILEHYGYIRRVTPDGIISTVDIGRNYNQAQSVVADDAYLYIADREGAVILRYPFD